MSTLPSSVQQIDPLSVVADYGQGDLFGAAFFAESEADLIRAARTYRHNGERVGADQARCAAIVAAKTLGWSDRRIAETLHVSRNSISHAVRALEQAGSLEPVKDRVMRSVAELTEVTLGRLREVLDSDGDLDPDLAGLIKSLWIGGGIGADKLAAPAPTLHLHQHVHQSTGQDAAAQYAALLAGVQNAAPVDCESTGFAVIDAGIGVGVAVDAAGDAGQSPAADAGLLPPARHPMPAAPPTDLPPAGQVSAGTSGGGGGGCVNAGGSDV